MINQKKEKNKMKKFMIIAFASLFSLSSFAIAEQCKTFDIACKTSNFINKSKDGYCFVINNDLQDVLIKELTPFAMLHRVGFKKINSNVVGHVSPSKYIDNAYCSNDDFEVSISIKEPDYEHSDSITYENWQAANKILGILFLHVEDTVKYRPIEINYDNYESLLIRGAIEDRKLLQE